MSSKASDLIKLISKPKDDIYLSATVGGSTLTFNDSLFNFNPNGTLVSKTLIENGTRVRGQVEVLLKSVIVYGGYIEMAELTLDREFRDVVSISEDQLNMLLRNSEFSLTVSSYLGVSQYIVGVIK